MYHSNSDEMTEAEIADAIILSLAERQFPIYLKKYDGGGMTEADVFGINRSGYMYEYEIKRSRSDFRADFKNKHYKHLILSSGKCAGNYDEWKNGKRTGRQIRRIGAPNRFYFACEAGLLAREDMPTYAGLVYIENGGLREIKSAPFIHKEKANDFIYARIATILCERCAWGMSYMTFKNKERVARFNELQMQHETN